MKIASAGQILWEDYASDCMYEYVPTYEYAENGISPSQVDDSWTLWKFEMIDEGGMPWPGEIADGDIIALVAGAEGDRMRSDTEKFAKYSIKRLVNGQFVNTIYFPNCWVDMSQVLDLESAHAQNEFYTVLRTKLDATNLKLDSELALTEGIRGAVVDVKNQPTDACIIRIYVGDQTKKREAAAREITRLLGEGYRPYQTFGISEDLARVLFVKYPEPNDANPVEP